MVTTPSDKMAARNGKVESNDNVIDEETTDFTITENSANEGTTDSEYSALRDKRREVAKRLSLAQRNHKKAAMREKIRQMESEIVKLDAPLPPNNTSSKQNGVSTEKEFVTFKENSVNLTDNADSRDAKLSKMKGNDNAGRFSPSSDDDEGKCGSGARRKKYQHIIAQSDNSDKSNNFLDNLNSMYPQDRHPYRVNAVHTLPGGGDVDRRRRRDDERERRDYIRREDSRRDERRRDDRSRDDHYTREQERRRRYEHTAGGSYDSGSSARSESSSWRRSQQPKRGKKLQSGVLAKATDIVLYPQDWPHIALQCDKIGGAYTFQELDTKMFVAGELELISREFSPQEERDGRIRLLKQLMYLSKVFDWYVILKFYTLVVSNIEQDNLRWSSDFEPTISLAISRQGSTKSGQSSKSASKGVSTKKGFTYKGRPTFCKEYQNNTCPFTDDKHWGVVNGERQQVEHICAVCLFRRKEALPHSEASQECPCKGARSSAQ